MALSMEEEDWLIASRSRRVTKTIRLDTTLIGGMRRGQLSDILNLALKRYLEAKANESQQDKKLRKEDAGTSGH